MNLRARRRRYVKQQKDAVKACLEGKSTVREASVKYRIAKSILADALKTPRDPQSVAKLCGRKPSFTVDEEKLDMQTLQKFAAHSVTLNRRHLCEALKIFITSLPNER